MKPIYNVLTTVPKPRMTSVGINMLIHSRTFYRNFTCMISPRNNQILQMRNHIGPQNPFSALFHQLFHKRAFSVAQSNLALHETSHVRFPATKSFKQSSFASNHICIKPAGLLARINSYTTTKPFEVSRNFHSSYPAYTPNTPKHTQPNNSDSHRYSKSVSHLTKQKLLAQATGPLSRLLVHIKWPLQRNNKPFTIDEVSALVSWFVMGNVLWILLGTTTFGLFVLYSVHAFDRVIAYFGDDEEGDKPKKDESVVGYITSAILSHGLGVQIEFSKGYVLPKLEDRKLTFRDIRIVSERDATRQFDFDVRNLSVSLSFGKWSDGNGLIQDLEVSGCKGRIYKDTDKKDTSVPSVVSDGPIFSRYLDSGQFHFDINDQPEISSPKKSTIDPDYQLGSVKILDSYFEVFEPESDVEPIRVSIFKCELPKLTGKSVLIDFFNADSVTGSINDSMFTIHKKAYGTHDNTIRFKLDGIDLAGLSRSRQSKFNWIMNGKAEIEADIRFPQSQEDSSVFKVEYRAIAEMVSKLLNDISEDTVEVENNENKLMKGALHAMYETFERDENDVNTPEDYVFITAKVKFSHLQAMIPQELPMASGHIPFLTLHDLRSLVTYINKLDPENTKFNVKTMAIEKLSELYNIGELSQAKVFDVLVSEIYDEFLKMVKMDEQRIIQQKSSLWSHSLASQLLLLGLGVIV